MSFSQEKLQNALQVVSSTIRNCEKMHPKFAQGTPQHSLLKNRIQALNIAKSLLENDGGIQAYTLEDLEKALPPVISIIHKTEKAQSKYEEGSTQFQRFSPIIEAMHTAKSLITDELSKKV